jgi:hypothetical protein
MRINISIMCDCGNEVARFKACAWTDYNIIDWSANIKCLHCQEKELPKE